MSDCVLKLHADRLILATRSPSRQRRLFSIGTMSNPALNLAPFGRWTLRDKAAQRRLA
jgi:hypothetical protein